MKLRSYMVIRNTVNEYSINGFARAVIRSSVVTIRSNCWSSSQQLLVFGSMVCNIDVLKSNQDVYLWNEAS